jgi:hypothetical protein
MKVIPETRRVHTIRYLPFYSLATLANACERRFDTVKQVIVIYMLGKIKTRVIHLSRQHINISRNNTMYLKATQKCIVYVLSFTIHSSPVLGLKHSGLFSPWRFKKT